MVFVNVLYVIVSLYAPASMNCQVKPAVSAQANSARETCNDSFLQVAHPDIHEPSVVCESETTSPSSPNEPEVFRPSYGKIDSKSERLMIPGPNNNQIFFRPQTGAKIQLPIDETHRPRRQIYLSESGDQALSLSFLADGTTTTKIWRRTAEATGPSDSNENQMPPSDNSLANVSHDLDSKEREANASKTSEINKLLTGLLERPDLELGATEEAVALIDEHVEPEAENENELSALEKMLFQLNREKLMRGWIDFRVADASKAPPRFLKVPSGLDAFRSELIESIWGNTDLQNARSHLPQNRHRARSKTHSPLEHWSFTLPSSIQLTRRRRLGQHL